MDKELVYWRHDTPAGVRVEEISGGTDLSSKVWKAMALQVFAENGGDRYRVIEHSPTGAPLLDDMPQRISVSHTGHFLCIAQLPPTPEADMLAFSPRAAMGIDCEKQDREQVMRIRERFLAQEELNLVEQDSVEANILAWTCKEALYKAALIPGLDFRAAIIIRKLPVICDSPAPLTPAEADPFGLAEILTPDGETIAMQLYSYRSEGHIVTMAYSPKCAKYKR